ncbi:MAG TPA: MG2 domain-containing protein [Nevskiaceae bacterium]|nr:MG2 domain-containing protein [Nevskiaceae bacterium]
MKDEKGDAVTGDRSFTFTTGGPAIRATMPYEGASVDEDQIFLLGLDAPATKASVEAHAYCAVKNLAERLPLKVLEGKERDEVLAQRKLLGYAYYRILWKDELQSVAQVTFDNLKRAEANIVAARCSRPLPAGAELDLVWSKGIATESGLTTTQDQAIGFRVRPAFSASFTCDRANEKANCAPILPMRLNFTAGIARKDAERIRLTGDAKRKPKLEKGDAPLVDFVTFEPPFPESGRFTIELPKDLKDDAGRVLANASSFPLAVQTDEAPPLAKFNGEFGIIELKQGGVLPVTIRSLDATVDVRTIGGKQKRIEDEKAIIDWLAKARKAQQGKWEEDRYQQPGRESVFAEEDGAQPFSFPAHEGGKTFEVVGIPLAEPGFHVVEIASPVLGRALLAEDRPRYVPTTALVTDLAVHFKWGREGSLAWVTRLSDGRPVAGADLKIVDACDATPFWTGTTGADGTVRIDAGLPKANGWESCEYGDARGLMVSARKDGDFSFTFTKWSNGITPGDFNINTGTWDGPDIGHTVTDRSLFRAGETVSMKHFFRAHSTSGFGVPAKAPTQIVLQHYDSGTKVELPVTFGNDGIAETTWTIPKEARLGTYSIEFQGNGVSERAGEFRVEQYRIPVMRAAVTPPAAPAVAVKELPLDLFVGYFSGGGAPGLPVKLRTQVRPRAIEFAQYESFRFGGAPVKEGIEEGGGGGYFPDEGEDAEAAAASKPQPARTQPLTLDANGAAHVVVPEIPASGEAQALYAELEYPDANGELASARSTTALWPSSIVTGLSTEGWVSSVDQLRFKVVVLDLKGRPVKGRSVDTQLYLRKTHSYRKRLVGGFYAYSHSTETKRIRASCDGRTDALGFLMCDVKPGESGQVVIEATAKDDDGRVARAVSETWVAGKDDWWFEQGPSDRMDLLPEKRAVEPGEKVRLQVRMPFRQATALVTVEREGVMRSFVTELSGREPVVELPVVGTDAPNVIVSVLAVRPRVSDFRSKFYDFLRWLGLDRWLRLDGGMPTALTDLSKPAYRLGMTNLDVGWGAHRLKVEVKPSAETYKTRGVAEVAVTVTPDGGGKMPASAEIAFSAVDEALLDLLANPSVKLLDAMMQRRGIEVFTSTAQMQVVGKRHYGRKSAPPGGGGGRGSPRELLNSLLLWKGRVPLDAAGRAVLQVPLNDALTEFRLTAVASAGVDRFGTGSASIRTTQDIQLLSGLAPLVRENDRYEAVFTVRNTTSSAREMDVEAEVTAQGRAAPLMHASLHLTVPANGAVPARFEMTAPYDVPRLQWTVRANGAGDESLDALKVAQDVIEAFPVRVFQATITQLEGDYELPVERPSDAIVGRGGVRVNLEASLTSSLGPVREWMGKYPYICYEQRLSQAVTLGERASWDALMAALPSYLDGDFLVRYFPASWLEGSDVLTAYVLAIGHEAGWEIPEDQRERMLDGLSNFVQGRIVRGDPMRHADQTERKLAALDALSRYGRAKAAWAASLPVDPNLWHTSAVIDWLGVLQRVEDMPDRTARIAEAQQVLRSRLNFQGTTMGFSTEQDDALWWLMLSADVNANRMILALLDAGEWREDMPRLMRGAVGRQRHGHWFPTTANAWGALALQKFAAKFEKDRVTGTSRAMLGGETREGAWKGSAPVTLDLPWPVGANDAAALAAGGSRSPDEVRDERVEGAANAGAAGAAGTLRLMHAGSGAPWAIVQSRAAIPLREPFSSGYRITRTVTPVEQKVAGRWSRGDVASVKVEVDAQSDMTWVVVEDPVPGGSTILGGGLGRDSALLSAGDRKEGDAWPAFEERRFDSYRAYYQYVPKGKFAVTYSVRFNSAGRFMLPATHVEAMYAPEMLGEAPNAPFVVEVPQ